MSMIFIQARTKFKTRQTKNCLGEFRSDRSSTRETVAVWNVNLLVTVSNTSDSRLVSNWLWRMLVVVILFSCCSRLVTWQKVEEEEGKEKYQKSERKNSAVMLIHCLYWLNQVVVSITLEIFQGWMQNGSNANAKGREGERSRCIDHLHRKNISCCVCDATSWLPSNVLTVWYMMTIGMIFMQMWEKKISDICLEVKRGTVATKKREEQRTTRVSIGIWNIFQMTLKKHVHTSAMQLLHSFSFLSSYDETLRCSCFSLRQIKSNASMMSDVRVWSTNICLWSKRTTGEKHAWENSRLSSRPKTIEKKCPQLDRSNAAELFHQP